MMDDLRSVGNKETRIDMQTIEHTSTAYEPSLRIARLRERALEHADGYYIDPWVHGYFGAFTLGLVRYFIHGLPEMLGYFIGGLAGGIISCAVIRKQFALKKSLPLLYDFFGLILVAVLLLFISAVLEVTVPMII